MAKLTAGMRINSSNDNWTTGDAYEAFMGRWSYRLAEKFLFTEPGIKLFVAGTGNLPHNPGGGFDCVVSGLVLNFLPDLLKSIKEMREHARKEGTVAA
jgi:hypothetical protein